MIERLVSMLLIEDASYTFMVTTADLATIVGTVLAVTGIAYKAGQMVQEKADTRREIEDEQRQLKEAHFSVHDDVRDIKNMLTEMNGDELSEDSNCSTCAEVTDSILEE